MTEHRKKYLAARKAFKAAKYTIEEFGSNPTDEYFCVKIYDRKKHEYKLKEGRHLVNYIVIYFFSYDGPIINLFFGYLDSAAHLKAEELLDLLQGDAKKFIIFNLDLFR